MNKQYIKVRFDNSANHYTYSAPANRKINKGDVVIVQIRGKLKMVQVTDLTTEANLNYPVDKIVQIHSTLKPV